MATFTLRYARAFQQAAAAQNLNVDAVRSQLSDFGKTFDDSHELREFLLNPSLPHGDKLKVLDAIGARIGIENTVRNFIAVLMDHDRLHFLSEIVEEYSALADEANGISEVEIVSAKPLSDDERNLLQGKAVDLAGTRVRVQWSEDAALLGGAVIRLRSRVYDGSVRGQLQQMKQHLAGV
jgi:F-type H+-transporting ATPase subunit delta